MSIAFYKSIMFNSHIIILPFHFHVGMTEMNIIFDITAVVPAYKCSHSNSYPVENVIPSHVFSRSKMLNGKMLCVS